MYPQALSGDDLAAALTNGAEVWLVLSLSAVLPILWAFALSCTSRAPTSSGSFGR